MASGQSQKPYDESKLQQLEDSTNCRKNSTSGIRHNTNNSANTHEHTLSDRVKGMANSARKLFHHHDHHAPDHAHKPCSNCSSGAKAKTDMKKKKKNDEIVKNHEGHERSCMTKMIDHVKNLKKNNNNSKEI